MKPLVRGSLFSDPAAPQANGEKLEVLLKDFTGLTLERIISAGQTTPQDSPYVQDEDEWVCLLAGSARLKIDLGGGQFQTISLSPGDWLVIPSKVPHWVTPIRASRLRPSGWRFTPASANLLDNRSKREPLPNGSGFSFLTCCLTYCLKNFPLRQPFEA